MKAEVQIGNQLSIFQSMIEGQYSELQQLCSQRHHRLVECKQLHQFNRECDELEQWIAEKETIACSEDLGKDLEHVEVRMYMSNHLYTVNLKCQYSVDLRILCDHSGKTYRQTTQACG